MTELDQVIALFNGVSLLNQIRPKLRPSLCNFDEEHMLYILTSVWVLHTPNTGRNSHSQHFFCKKAKKRKKFAANFCKNVFF